MKLKNCDIYLGEILELLTEVLAEIKENKDDGIYKDLFSALSREMLNFWEIREKIYQVEPQIKRDFLLEMEEDKERFDELNRELQQALSLYREGDFPRAKEAFNQVLSKAQSGYFANICKAKIYDCDKQINKSFKQATDKYSLNVEFLDNLHQRAVKLKQDGMNKEAEDLFLELATLSRFSYFEIISKANLFDLNQQ
ncbi:MAG: hypothetical protein J6M05_03260 [Cardiobacteriaceae bacterium]|nr:hypothetical protein [Cardiobacteriaceae bacterium]